MIHPRSGENTQILVTCSVGFLTAQERKEPEESWLLGRSQGVVGECPCLDSWGHMFLRPRIQESLVPVVQILRFSHLPLSVAPHLWDAGPWMFDALSPEAQGEGMSWVLRGCLGRAAP